MGYLLEPFADGAGTIPPASEAPVAPVWADYQDCRKDLSWLQCAHCLCGECCEKLIIEVLPEDAEREPLIRKKGSPIYTPPELTESGKPELEGYLLSTGMGCVFLNAETKLCTIYRTRPLVCRLFDCDGKDKEELVQLGILTDRSQGRSR
jgi:hypothetical protein